MRPTMRLLSVCSLALGMTALTGCEPEDPTRAAVRSGARDLRALAGGGPAPAPADMQRETYTKVAAAVQPVAGTEGSASAAGLILAQAQSGLSEGPAAEALRLERESLNRLTVLRATFDQWLSHTVAAQAAAAYDPSAQIEEYRSAAAALDPRIAEQRTQKDQVEAQIADLRSRAKSKADEGQALALRYAEMRERSLTMTATQAEGLIREANLIKRQGDALTNDGQRLTAEADLLQPQAVELGLLTAQLENQKASVERALKELEAQREASRAEAATAGAASAQAAESIKSELDALRTLRSGPLAEAYASALQNLSTSGASARKAATSAAAQSKLGGGSASQGAGDLHLIAAGGHRQVAVFLESIAGATPAFPDATAVAQAAKEARDAEKASLESAKAAYEQARDAFSGVSARGEIKDRLTRLSETLDLVARWAGGEAVDLSAAARPPEPAEEAPAEQPAPDQAPAPAADDESAIRAILAASIEGQRAGDMSAFRSMMHAASPDEQAFIDASIDSQEAIARLDNATKARFQGSFVEALARNPMAGQAASTITAALNTTADDYQITINGDSAVASAPNIPIPVTFARIDGQWKATVDLSQIPPEARGMTLGIMQASAEAARGAQADLEAGSLQSADAVVNAFMLKLQPAIMRLMQQQGGGGG